MSQEFNINIKGKVKNVSLAKRDALLPLLEAIINSIQSIEDINNQNYKGYIEINVIRDTSQAMMDIITDRELYYPITSFEIKDNGVGFNEINFSSFKTSDSIHKSKKGCKGIGRFLWLKCFDYVSVESVYQKENNNYIREFDFVLDDKQPIEVIKDEVTSKQINTIVKLNNFRKEYSKHCPKKLDTIANKIIEHCIFYFVLDNCPIIILKDDFDEFNLNIEFKKNFAKLSEPTDVKIGNYNFNIIHAKLYKSDDKNHKIHYMANNREVKNISLNKSKHISNLDNKLIDEENRNFIYRAFVASKYLDDTVNSERTDFSISEQNTPIGEFLEEPSFEDINKFMIIEILKYLDYSLKEVNKIKMNSILDYINVCEPKYRYLIKNHYKKLEGIPVALKEEELEIELHNIQMIISHEIKEETKKFLSVTENQDYKIIKEKYESIAKNNNDIGKAALADYIIHRKTVLKLLKVFIEKYSGSDFSFEKDIHNLIFPMKNTSEDITYEDHNLWIIDEKLSYHSYLASDLPLKKNEILNSESSSRPDMWLLNSPVAITNDNSGPYNSIVIFEFKRPMRDDYSESDNPIDQLYGYAHEIREGIKKDFRGRTIKITKTAPIYLYAISDITNSLEKILKNKDFTLSPDLNGYYSFHKGFNAHIEVIPFDKLLSDAIKRNEILFSKLFGNDI